MDENLITVRGVVRALDGDEALVEVEQGGCGRCHEEGGCGGQQLTQMFCSGPKSYRAENAVGAAVGDRVTVATLAGDIRKTANLAYGLPLLATILGAVFGMSVAGDLGGIGGAIVGVLGAFGFIRYRARQGEVGTFAHPRIVSRS